MRCVGSCFTLIPFFRRPMSFESAKATETASELRKAREKMHDQEMSLSTVEQEKKSLLLKVKELESVLDRRPQVSGGCINGHANIKMYYSINRL